MKIGLINLYSKYPKLNYFKWHFNVPLNVDNLLENVLEYSKDKEYVWDCDQGGNSDYYYVVGNEGEFRFFHVKHSWGWDSDSDEDRDLYNEFDIKEVSRVDVTAIFKDMPSLV